MDIDAVNILPDNVLSFRKSSRRPPTTRPPTLVPVDEKDSRQWRSNRTPNQIYIEELAKTIREIEELRAQYSFIDL